MDMRILFFVFLIVTLFFVVQLLNVGQLIRKLKGQKEEDVNPQENKNQAILLSICGLMYFAGVIWTSFRYGWSFIKESASEHGVLIDRLLAFNWIILGLVFFLVHILLFVFTRKYIHRKDQKAHYYAHNNTLEIIWTSIPATVMSIIIIWGLWTWNDIMGQEVQEDATNIELYAKQFDWTARYPGKDGKFGLTNYNLVYSANPLGIVTPETVNYKLQEVEEDLSNLRAELLAKKDQLSDRQLALKNEKIRNLVLHKNRILQINLEDPRIKDGEDDILVKSEFHLPVDKQASFQFRSRDVIHSALMFDFRAQMNAVPGVPTIFKFTPTVTTEQMRLKRQQPEFNYQLTCNKICGASHWNMVMDIVVESEADFKNWLEQQKTFKN